MAKRKNSKFRLFAFFVVEYILLKKRGIIMNYKKMSTLALTDNVRHTDQLFIKKGKLYKIFTDFYSFEDEKERNITFLLKNRISNTPNIIKKLRYHGRFIGYIMEFIPNTVTFRKAINSDIDYEKRIYYY